MDWCEYKRLCDRPQLFSRWMIEQSMELVSDHPQLSQLLRQTLISRPLDKPSDHRGGPATDMFVLRLEHRHAAAVYRRVQHATDTGQRTAATSERGLGGFAAAWRDYVGFLANEVAALEMSDLADRTHQQHGVS